MKQKFLSLLLIISSFAFAYPPAGAFHDIAVDFQGTFSALDACCNDLNNSITECCADLSQDFAFTWTILNDIFQASDNSGVYTSLNEINKNFCSPAFIMQSDVGTTGFSIASSGVYKLGEDITFSPTIVQPAIGISADKVLLDLQCFTLSQGNSLAGVNGITILGADKVTIKNGAIENFTEAGIRASGGPDKLRVNSVNFDGNNRALWLDGSSTPITNAKLKTLIFVQVPLV